MMLAIRAALALIPRELLALALAAVTAWGAVIGHQRNTAQRDAARLSAAIAAERAQIAAGAASASEHARAVEAQRTESIRQAQEAHDAQSKTLAADAARARTAADRLRVALDTAARTLRATGSTPTHPGAASSSETGARAAELLGACATRYRELAVDADRAVSAGQLCERSYDALTGR